MVGMLCDVLEIDGAEAQRLAVEAIIATAKEEKRGILRRAFFALSATGVSSGVATTTGVDATMTAANKLGTKASGYTLSRLDVPPGFKDLENRYLPWLRVYASLDHFWPGAARA
jgi:hypothetical protein